MYQALRAKRCYKEGWDFDKTVNLLEDDALGGKIDQRMWGLFKCFLRDRTTEGGEYFVGDRAGLAELPALSSSWRSAVPAAPGPVRSAS